VIKSASDGIKEVSAPLSDADIEALNAGDRVRITGVVYTARDAAHGRLMQLIDAGKPLPIDVRVQVMSYPGHSPASMCGSSRPWAASRAV